MSHRFINQLKEGEPLNGVYLVADKQLRKTRTAKPFLTVELQDKTGSIKGVIWENADSYNRLFKTGDLVLCQAVVEPYQNELQAKISSISADIPGEVDHSNYFSHTSKDIELLLEELKEILSTVKEPHLAALIKAFLNDAKFMDTFKKTPAAIEHHHAYVGGLLEHTVNLLQMASQIVSYYHSLIDSNLLLTGIFLHDIGKIREYEIQITPRMTDEGCLLGHTLLGINMLEEKARLIKDFPPERLTLLRHLIGSHHGQHEFGAPVLPNMLTLAECTDHHDPSCSRRRQPSRNCRN